MRRQAAAPQHAPLGKPPVFCHRQNKGTTVSMCEPEHHFGSVVEPGLVVTAETALVRFTAICWKMRAIPVSCLFAEAFRTDDTDPIPYSRLYLPCSLARLLALPLCSLLFFFLEHLICIVSISRESKSALSCSRQN